MIIPFAILTYKLFKKFPILVLSIFVFHLVNTITIDKEREENEKEIEYISAYQTKLEVEEIDPSTPEIIVEKSNNPTSRLATKTSNYKHQIHNKLYILYSRLQIDRYSLNTSELNKKSISNTKYYNHGNCKENNYRKAINNSCNLFCDNVNYHNNHQLSLKKLKDENDKQNNRRKSNSNSEHLLYCDSGHINSQLSITLNSINHGKYKAINRLNTYNNSKCLLYNS
jgi:hypothetical protein